MLVLFFCLAVAQAAPLLSLTSVVWAPPPAGTRGLSNASNWKTMRVPDTGDAAAFSEAAPWPDVSADPSSNVFIASGMQVGSDSDDTLAPALEFPMSRQLVRLNLGPAEWRSMLLFSGSIKASRNFFLETSEFPGRDPMKGAVVCDGVFELHDVFAEVTGAPPLLATQNCDLALGGSMGLGHAIVEDKGKVTLLHNSNLAIMTANAFWRINGTLTIAQMATLRLPYNAFHFGGQNPVQIPSSGQLELQVEAGTTTHFAHRGFLGGGVVHFSTPVGVNPPSGGVLFVEGELGVTFEASEPMFVDFGAFTRLHPTFVAKSNVGFVTSVPGAILELIPGPGTPQFAGSLTALEAGEVELPLEFRSSTGAAVSVSLSQVLVSELILRTNVSATIVSVGRVPKIIGARDGTNRLIAGDVQGNFEGQRWQNLSVVECKKCLLTFMPVGFPVPPIGNPTMLFYVPPAGRLLLDMGSITGGAPDRVVSPVNTEGHFTLRSLYSTLTIDSLEVAVSGRATLASHVVLSTHVACYGELDDGVDPALEYTWTLRAPLSSPTLCLMINASNTILRVDNGFTTLGRVVGMKELDIFSGSTARISAPSLIDHVTVQSGATALFEGPAELESIYLASTVTVRAIVTALVHDADPASLNLTIAASGFPFSTGTAPSNGASVVNPLVIDLQGTVPQNETMVYISTSPVGAPTAYLSWTTVVFINVPAPATGADFGVRQRIIGQNFSIDLIHLNTIPTFMPSAAPTVNPSAAPTSSPTGAPSTAPTASPTAAPSVNLYCILDELAMCDAPNFVLVPGDETVETSIMFRTLSVSGALTVNTGVELTVSNGTELSGNLTLADNAALTTQSFGLSGPSEMRVMFATRDTPAPLRVLGNAFFSPQLRVALRVAFPSARRSRQATSGAQTIQVASYTSLDAGSSPPIISMSTVEPLGECEEIVGTPTLGATTLTVLAQVMTDSSKQGCEPGLPLGAIIGIAVGGALLVAVVLTVSLVMWRRKEVNAVKMRFEAKREEKAAVELERHRNAA